MPSPLEDYAIIGDLRTAAIVSRGGSIDWWAAPRFDSEACFCALVGGDDAAHWSIAPLAAVRTTERRYRDNSLVLETLFETEGGRVRVTDCMLIDCVQPTIVRTVVGLTGRVTLRSACHPRFYYGYLPASLRGSEGELYAIAGPDALVLRSSLAAHWEGKTAVSEFTVEHDETATFVLSWYPSHRKPPPPFDAAAYVQKTDAWWQRWAARCLYDGPWREAVVRSALILKALTFSETGAIVAAATTSLPEQLGGTKNWDYRYCWLRDASFTSFAFLSLGYTDEVTAWRDWFLRMCAGDPSKLQIMYGIAGERRLQGHELPWLCGYENSKPVRVGNDAATQFQLGVYGQVLTALEFAQRRGVAIDAEAWSAVRQLLDFVEAKWRTPGSGFWETRAGGRQYVDSKMMAWVAFDRALRLAKSTALDAPVAHWEAVRERIARQVSANGFDPERGAFTQYYGSQELDATALLFPMYGFLPYDDERMRSTVRALESELLDGGFLYRYSKDVTQGDADATPAEGTFIACGFWLAANYARSGRRADGEQLFERLLAIRNDVGLLSEEYDTTCGRLVGNVPQALSHAGLIQTAIALGEERGPLDD